jgi:hypothetical protein
MLTCKYEISQSRWENDDVTRGTNWAIVRIYLAVSESGWLSRHGGDVEQDEGMRLVIQFRIGPDDSGDRVNGEVAIRIAGIDGVAGCVGTWA